MNSRICRCCGEPMPEQGNNLSRNPNVCASCSSMADGMEESGPPESASLRGNTAETIAEDPLHEHAVDPEIHQALK